MNKTYIMLTMNKIFAYCYMFNQSLNKWDVSKVVWMDDMFFSCYKIKNEYYPNNLKNQQPHHLEFLTS